MTLAEQAHHTLIIVKGWSPNEPGSLGTWTRAYTAMAGIATGALWARVGSLQGYDGKMSATEALKLIAKEHKANEG